VVEIFFCYAHEDEELLKKLKTHLIPLQREGFIDIWHDRDISAGTEWQREVDKHISSAQIILLLVSPDFMASDYCYGKEMKRALERHERGEARVIPIILEHVYWQIEPLNRLQALPEDAKPIMSACWHNLNEAMYNVVEGIRNAVGELSIKSPVLSSAASAKTSKRELLKPSIHISAPEPTIKPGEFTLENTLKGHLYAVLSVAISPNQKTLVSGGLDPEIGVWDLLKGKLLRTLKGHSGGIWSIVYSPDGKTLVSGGQDKTIKVWDTYTGKILDILTGHSNAISSVAISPKGKILASGSWDSTIRSWNLQTGHLLQTFPRHSNSVTSVAISSNEQILASGSADSTITVWNLRTGELFGTFKGHSNTVTSVAISHDGQTLVSGSVDQTIRVWEMPTGKLLRTLAGHSERITSVAISPSGKVLISSSADLSLKVWNLKTGDLLQTLTEHSGLINGVVINQDEQIIVSCSGGRDNAIKIWTKK
jgi:WD40 repeat protein